MLASVLRHLRRNLVAYVALLFALSGSSYAAATSINGSQIKPHTIARNRLTNKAITQLKGNRGPRGAQGAQGVRGPTGAQGVQGVQGPPGVTHADERFFARNLADPNTWLPIVSGAWPNVEPTHVLTMHLDAGNYTVAGEIIAGNYSGEGIVVCLFGNADVGFVVGQSGVGNTEAGFALQQTFGLQAIFSLDAPADLELSCFNAPPNQPAGNPTIGAANVVATKIHTVNVTEE